MRHIAKATGATQVLTFADIEGGETFDAALLGSAEEVVEERVADDDVILIKGAKSSRALEVEQQRWHSLSTWKIWQQHWAQEEQLAVVEFALSLLIILKVLAVNAAKDAGDQ